MNRFLQFLIVLTLVFLLLAACGGAKDEPESTETRAPATATLAPLATLRVEPQGEAVTPVPPTPTQVVLTPGDFQPLDQAACSDLADGLAQAVGVAATTAEAPFKHWVNQREGVGCQITASGVEPDIPNVANLFPAAKALLETRGWYEDNLNAGGGGGSGAILSGFTQANGTCQLSVISGPVEDELCSADEPIFVCMEGLAPEQRLHTVTINCALDATVDAVAQLDTSPGDWQPLSYDECNNLAGALAQSLGLTAEAAQAPFEDYVQRRAGTGCQATLRATGLNFEHVGLLESPTIGTLQALGWQQDASYGGGGPGGVVEGFRQGRKLCLLLISSGPSEASLCSADEPFAVCWERLTPEQKAYTVTLNCAQDAAAVDAPQDEPTRIQFAPGATSAQMSGSLFADQIQRYVLGAAAGQEMTVNLYTSSGDNPFPGAAVLVIWGADGTVLISDHAGATDWTGVLPLTQDYYVDVRSAVPSFVDYVLDVSIPPAAGSAAEKAFPLVEPLEFQPYLQALVLTGVPVMLPPQFPVGEGLPPIYPYIYTAEDGLYELSLDYGADCQGAGACHYGSMMAHKVDSDVPFDQAHGKPVGTVNFIFDAQRAQEVSLANGIQGYFFESVCAANCSDAQVFWVYDGFEYMLGLQSGIQQEVLDLANAAILNSVGQ
jgi:hypothetical protein